MSGQNEHSTPLVALYRPGTGPRQLNVVECLRCAALVEVDALDRHLRWHEVAIGDGPASVDWSALADTLEVDL